MAKNSRSLIEIGYYEKMTTKNFIQEIRDFLSVKWLLSLVKCKKNKVICSIFISITMFIRYKNFQQNWNTLIYNIENYPCSKYDLEFLTIWRNFLTSFLRHKQVWICVNCESVDAWNQLAAKCFCLKVKYWTSIIYVLI